MPINAQIGSTTYQIPSVSERSWGVNTTNLLVRLAQVANQVVQSQFILTANYTLKDTSGQYGLQTNFIQGIGSTASSDGFLRLASPYSTPGQGLSYPTLSPAGRSYTYISWRNSTNDGNLHLYPNPDNNTLLFSGHSLADLDSIQSLTNKTFGISNTATFRADRFSLQSELDFDSVTFNLNNLSANRTISFADAAGTLILDSASQTLTNKVLGNNVDWQGNKIANSYIGPGPTNNVAISDSSGYLAFESFLASSRGGLGTNASGFNGVVKSSSGSFSASLINNADIATSAAIALNKLALLTPLRALVSDGSGLISAASVTSAEIGHLSGVTSAIQTQIDSKIPLSQIGIAGGVAGLDGTGKVPAAQLPSYVDDVLEYANLGSFPASGETGKIYVALNTGKTYRWSGSAYTEISPSDVNSVNGQTGVVLLTSTNISEGTNLYFTDERAQDAVGNSPIDSSTIDFSYIDAANTISAAVIPSGIDKNALGGSPLTIANGGTGASSAVQGRTNLLPSQTSNAGKALVTDGTDVSWQTISGGGGGGLSPTPLNGPTTLASGNHYLVSMGSSAYSVTLPAGSTGAAIRLTDADGLWSIYNLTIIPSNGQIIDGGSANETLICDTRYGWVELSWNGSKWVSTTQSTVNVPTATATSQGVVKGGEVPGSTSGTATGNGYLGQVVEQIINTNTPFAASGNPLSIASVTLSPGIWSLSFQVLAQSNGATVQSVGAWISTLVNSTTGRDLADNYAGTAPPTSNYSTTMSLADYNLNISSNSTYYLTVIANYSTGSPVAIGRVRARRIG